jgi:hypothetical protein
MQGPAMNKPDSMVYIAAHQKIQNSIAQETAFFFILLQTTKYLFRIKGNEKGYGRKGK